MEGAGETPRSLYFEMYDLSIAIADRFRMTPFELFAQDCDEVISLINYYIEKGSETGKPNQPRVNDGFWDNM